MMKIDTAENEFVAVTFRDVVKLGDDAAARLGLRKREVDGLLFVGQLDALDLFQFFDAALDLFGFGGLIAEAADERFQLLDALALVAIGCFQLLGALLFLLQKLFVVARIEMHAAIPNFDDFVDRDVQEIAVVRDQHEGERIVGKILLQPVARFQIQVIGGLIEQQQVGFFEQQFGECDAHLPAAGKFLGAFVPLLVREAEAGKHGAHLRFDGVAVAIAEFAVQLMEAIGHLRVLGAGGIQFAHLVRELSHLHFHLLQGGEDRHAFGEHAAAGKREAVLREVAGTDAARDAELAVVKRFHPGEHFQQCGFTAAIGAHQASTVLGRDHPVEFFK